MKMFLLGLALIPAFVLPSVASECRPKTVSIFSVASQKSMQTFLYRGSTYRYVHIRGTGMDEKFSAVYREKGDRCWVTWVDPVGDAVTLSDGVPRPVAIALAKGTIQRMVEKKGKPWMLEQFAKSKTIAPEAAEALKVLGYPLPEHIKILPWGKPEHETLVNEKY
jgi:hypothetical protein